MPYKALLGIGWNAGRGGNDVPLCWHLHRIESRSRGLARNLQNELVEFETVDRPRLAYVPKHCHSGTPTFQGSLISRKLRKTCSRLHRGLSQNIFQVNSYFFSITFLENNLKICTLLHRSNLRNHTTSNQNFLFFSNTLRFSSIFIVFGTDFDEHMLEEKHNERNGNSTRF